MISPISVAVFFIFKALCPTPTALIFCFFGLPTELLFVAFPAILLPPSKFSGSTRVPCALLLPTSGNPHVRCPPCLSLLCPRLFISFKPARPAQKTQKSKIIVLRQASLLLPTLPFAGGAPTAGRISCPACHLVRTKPPPPPQVFPSFLARTGLLWPPAHYRLCRPPRISLPARQLTVPPAPLQPMMICLNSPCSLPFLMLRLFLSMVYLEGPTDPLLFARAFISGCFRAAVFCAFAGPRSPSTFFYFCASPGIPPGASSSGRQPHFLTAFPPRGLTIALVHPSCKSSPFNHSGLASATRLLRSRFLDVSDPYGLSPEASDFRFTRCVSVKFEPSPSVWLNSLPFKSDIPVPLCRLPGLPLPKPYARYLIHPCSLLQNVTLEWSPLVHSYLLPLFLELLRKVLVPSRPSFHLCSQSFPSSFFDRSPV